MKYSDYRAGHTSTNILNEDEGPTTKSPISRAKSTQPQGKVRVVPDKTTPAPKAAAPAPTPAPKAAAPAPTPAPKAAAPAPKAAARVPAPKPTGETAESRASRQAAYNEWKSSNAEPTAKLAQETAGKVGYQGFKKGGGIDGIARQGKTKGRYI